MAGFATLDSTTAARAAELISAILPSSSVFVAFCDCNDDKKSFCVESSISNDAEEQAVVMEANLYYWQPPN